jgi:serine/threonine protein phosphatase PrpC
VSKGKEIQSRQVRFLRDFARAVATLKGIAEKELAGLGLTDPQAGAQVRAALEELNLEIQEERRRGDTAGLGATIVLALLRGRQGLIAHLGDSRAYLSRAGRLEVLTRDHTRARRLLDTGQITPEEGGTLPLRRGAGPVPGHGRRAGPRRARARAPPGRPAAAL